MNAGDGAAARDAEQQAAPREGQGRQGKDLCSIERQRRDDRRPSDHGERDSRRGLDSSRGNRSPRRRSPSPSHRHSHHRRDAPPFRPRSMQQHGSSRQRQRSRSTSRERRQRSRSRSRERRRNCTPPRSSKPPAPAGTDNTAGRPAATAPGFVRGSTMGGPASGPAAVSVITAAQAAAATLAAAAPPAGTASGLSVDQKRKLLWGKKKEAAAAPSAGAVPAHQPSGTGVGPAVFGRNRWDCAEFGSEEERHKFLKLMGGKAAAHSLPAPGPVYGPALPGQDAQQAAAEAGPLPADAGAFEGEAAPDIMKRDKQQEVLGELERGFQAGLRRQLQTHRTVGLGL